MSAVREMLTRSIGGAVLLCSLLLGLESAAYGELAFQAGLSVISLDPPEGIPLAGYGGGARRHWWGTQNPFAYYLTAAVGVHDPVRSKALVVQIDKARVALVSLDVIVPSSAMVRELARRLEGLGFDESSIIVAATHTHSGPGAYIQNTLLEVSVVDQFVPEVLQHMTDAVERSIREAVARLAPARIGVAIRSIAGVTSNRRRKEPIESGLTMMRIDHLDGRPMAVALNFPIHPTMLGHGNLFLSADVPGAVERAFQDLNGIPAVFFNGAEGDVSPVGPRGNFEELDRLGRKIAEEATLTWKALRTSLPSRFKIAQTSIDLEEASLNILPCLTLNKGSGHLMPPLSTWPRKATLTGFSIDEHVFIGVPGEPTVLIGDAIRREGATQHFLTTSILGLSNEYLGYILSDDDYYRGGYEACVSFYGPSLGDRILTAVSRLLNDLRRGDRS